ncbi:CdaR family protein [Ectobacillus panaciterrae]|uniref:CdaR family protein n=1 Tax=Ectobacillus panaciterrae TaxID=363872 RepID=UPI0004184FD6|nr:CdaR family protein [Ectobacillus panaciterrae]
MDKLMDNHWFLKGLALLLALMLYMFTSLDKPSESSGITASTGLPVGETTETLSNVAVAAHYNQEEYVVTGLPKSVTLTLEGQSNLITATKINQQFEVYANLNGYQPGVYDVMLQYEGINDKVKVKILPAKVRVTIAKKIKKAFPVEIGFINSNKMKEGYMTDKTAVKPALVEISGTEAQLEKISLVKAYIDLKGADQTITKETKVVVYDKDGNPLDVQANPSTVTVTVPIITPEKKVPVNVTRQGTLQEGVTITNITVDPEQVTLYGPNDVLSNIQSVDGVVIDLDKVTSSTTFDAPIVLPKGVTKASPDKVKVTVQVQKQERTSFSDIPLQVLGLTDAFNVNFLDPQSGKVNVDVVGESSVISKLAASQIQASINVQNLAPGTYDVPIQINSPNNVTLELKQKNAKIEVVKKS